MNGLGVTEQELHAIVHGGTGGRRSARSTTAAAADAGLQQLQQQQQQHNAERGDIFATCGADRRAHIWDLSRTTLPLPTSELVEGPAELVFTHGGHTNKVSDCSWNPNMQFSWRMASVDEENILNLWKMNSCFAQVGRKDRSCLICMCFFVLFFVLFLSVC